MLMEWILLRLWPQRGTKTCRTQGESVRPYVCMYIPPLLEPASGRPEEGLSWPQGGAELVSGRPVLASGRPKGSSEKPEVASERTESAS